MKEGERKRQKEIVCMYNKVLLYWPDIIRILYEHNLKRQPAIIPYRPQQKIHSMREYYMYAFLFSCISISSLLLIQFIRIHNVQCLYNV